MAVKRALFLDRDGVINHEVGYLHRPDEVRFVDGIFPLCRTAQALGLKLVVVTNQSGIARGMYTEADFHALMDWFRTELTLEGITLDRVYHCPYHPTHGVGEWRREHADRKPGTGMLLRGRDELGVELAESFLIGDRCSDIEAANAAGLRQAFLLTGTEPTDCPGEAITIDRLDEAEEWLRLHA